MPENQKIKEILFIYYGLNEDKLFIQFADEDSRIAFSHEQKVKSQDRKAIMDIVEICLSCKEFKTSGISEPYKHLACINGKMIDSKGQVIYAEELPEDMENGIEYNFLIAIRENNR